jgi:glutathione peroxidase
MLIRRRKMVAILAGCIALPSLARSQDMTRMTAYAFSFAGLDGQEIKLAEHSGAPILVVNTASLCGYTPQYAGLQQLWLRYQARGLLIIGVPSNDFGGQEPGGADEIAKTARGEYHVAFPLAAKAQVKGQSPHPFYKWAAAERPLETPRWNFLTGWPHRGRVLNRRRANGSARHQRDRPGASCTRMNALPRM